MSRYIKDNWKVLLLGVIGVLIVVPFLTQLLINFETNSKGSDDGWLGFWGGYLGAIIGVAGAIFVVQIQLNEENKSREVEKVDNTFFNLLSLHNEQKNTLTKKSTFEEIYSRFNEALKEQLLKEGLDFFYSQSDLIIGVLRDIIKGYRSYIEANEKKLSPESLSRWEKRKKGEFSFDDDLNPNDSDLFDTLSTSLNNINEIEQLQDSINDKKINYFSNIVSDGVPEGAFERINGHIQTYIRLQHEISEECDKLISDLEKYKSNHFDLLPDYRKKQGIESILTVYYNEIGSYFRIFHRIIKYINKKVPNEENRKDYLGFLRATLNEKELLVIFYNAVYTDRGSGLLEELSKTTFFGEYHELLENGTIQHFNSSSLLWKSDDLKIMRGFGKE